MNEVLSSFGIKTKKDYKSLEWQTKKSTPNTILFYQYHQSENSYIEFLKRAQSCSYGILITSGLEDKPLLENHYNFVHEVFLDLQLRLCRSLYPYSSKMKFIGITGTNGKTTTVHFISEFLKQKSICALSIGTLGILKDGVEVENLSMTTPPMIDLYKILHKHSQEVEFVVMELSSHALVQERIKGIVFESTGWTSFSQDHLDYHKTIEEYFEAKSLVGKISKTPIVVSSKATSFINKIEIKEIYECPFTYENSFLKISYNQVNLDVALGCLKNCNIKISKNDVELLRAPLGRFNLIENKKQMIVIDYAHTPDAIENISKESRNYFKKEIITLFGCGGDRDKSKRPLMLEAALKYSDNVIITSDNPRTEDPEQIIKDIVKNYSGEKVKQIIDRKEAIIYALENNNNAVILILGKGHEPYLDIKGVKYAYSDEVVVRDYINDKV